MHRHFQCCGPPTAAGHLAHPLYSGSLGWRMQVSRPPLSRVLQAQAFSVFSSFALSQYTDACLLPDRLIKRILSCVLPIPPFHTVPPRSVTTMRPSVEVEIVHEGSVYGSSHRRSFSDHTGKTSLSAKAALPLCNLSWLLLYSGSGKGTCASLPASASSRICL